MQGSVIPVVLDLTANHQGWFTFKICPNNDIWYQSISIWANPNVIAGRTQNNLALTCSLSLWAKIGLLGIQSLTTGLVLGSSMSICHGGRTPFWNFSIDKICCYCTRSISLHFTICLGILFPTTADIRMPFLRMLFVQVILFPMHPAVDLHSWQQLGRLHQRHRRAGLRTSGDIQVTPDWITIIAKSMFSHRACSDIRILPSGKRKKSPSKVSDI